MPRSAVLLVFDTHSGAMIAKLPTVAVADDVYYDHARKRIYVTGGGGVVDVYQQKDCEHYAESPRCTQRLAPEPASLCRG